MTARSSVKTFLRTVIAVAAIGGVAAGMVMGANQTVKALSVGDLSAGEIAYLALAGASFLLLVTGLVMGRGMPALLWAVALAAFGAALSGLVHDFEGRTADVVLWLSGFAFGGALGILLARRIGRQPT